MTSERESSTNLPNPPSFEEWVEYCFVHGQRDFNGTSKDSPEAIEQRENRFLLMDRVLVVGYLTRLFEKPSFIADRYTDDQIADATWFLFGHGSQFISFKGLNVAEDAQARCIRAVATLYTDLFDRVCGRRGTDLNTAFHGQKGIDGAVYMIWDMGGLEFTVMFPDSPPHLIEPGTSVLEAVLAKCRTSACLVSALHGVGHVIGFNICGKSPAEQAKVDRFQGMIDSFLATREVPDWLRKYAGEARTGNIE